MNESRTSNASESETDSLYFRVESIKLSELYDWCNKSNIHDTAARSPLAESVEKRSLGLNKVTDYFSSGKAYATMRCGRKVNVNHCELALFRKDQNVYAVEDKCPHAGGPLHMGDIEDYGYQQKPCVRCPYHGWKFDLTTGECIYPRHQTKQARVYPVKVDPNDGSLWVGFKCFNEQYFREPSW
ncbi:Rieske domain-containing protein [Hyalella azteca]|uniref:Rieske domain-containing protein n=1 Tax=Hyalella azteca TaxID=294128 RepID=A0A8B7N3F8_HYAAZ|nr:Rieske domain-containing protein [Hyalella azteca]